MLSAHHLQLLQQSKISEVELAHITEADDYIFASLRKDPSYDEESALTEIYKRMRPGDPVNLINARLLIKRLFFDPRRYDLSRVGRYKYNKKLAIGARIRGKVAARIVEYEVVGSALAYLERSFYLGNLFLHRVELIVILHVHSRNFEAVVIDPAAGAGKTYRRTRVS